MPATPTYSVALVDAIKAELEAHLPAALITAGLPAVKSWCYGQRELAAITNCPQVEIDLGDGPQTGSVGYAKAEDELLVIAQLAATDEETLHRYLLGYGDAIRSELEKITSPRVAVTGVDRGPSASKGNAIFRAVIVTGTIVWAHTRGSVT